MKEDRYSGTITKGQAKVCKKRENIQRVFVIPGQKPNSSPKFVIPPPARPRVGISLSLPKITAPKHKLFRLRCVGGGGGGGGLHLPPNEEEEEEDEDEDEEDEEAVPLVVPQTALEDLQKQQEEEGGGAVGAQ